ncbi:transposable element Tcb2 transposase [Trichonephila clavipes]|uniref:Transposable element Tcb2 transposase n=1 Tax=Trichonephila clavipes TaxID=2585209 RepID=A0A8X6WFC3_TRICX|nr:transposable element Tcb2 transposase [Trichonephila clavipes]
MKDKAEKNDRHSKWEEAHVNWRRNEWHNILFHVKSHFNDHPDNKGIFIWRERVNRNNPASELGSVKFGNGAIMVYAVIPTNRRTDLHIIRIGALIGRQ